MKKPDKKCNHKLVFVETLKNVVTNQISNLTIQTDADLYICKKCNNKFRLLPHEISIIST